MLASCRQKLMDVNASHDNLDENMVEELEMGEEDT